MQRKSATTTYRGNDALLRALLLCCGLWGVFCWLPLAHGQRSLGEIIISKIEIRHIGPASVNDALIRDNLRSRVGDPYRPITVDDDVRNLYATGLFYNIRVTREQVDGGMVLTYIVQANPRLSLIKIEGNSRMSLSKIKKKITSKVGDPLEERKLFTDSLAIRELYQKSGYPNTEVKYVTSIDEAAGRGSVTFEIKESPKIKIVSYEFVGVTAFSESKLRTEMLGWWSKNFAWMIGYGSFQEDKFEEEEEKLRQFYFSKGYIDFEIQNVEYVYPEPTKLTLRLHVFEGKQYRVGNVTFVGTTMLPTNAVSPSYIPGKVPKPGPERLVWAQGAILNRDFVMKQGSVFTAQGLGKDTDAIQNFYDARGFIDVGRAAGGLRVTRVPNVEAGTMDLQFMVQEGQKSFIEKIDIRGNTKTKDKVIRRELAVSPGETFDMVRVRVSEQRLKGLDYFAKVEARPQATEISNRKDLLIGVEEKNTGNLSFGAGFSSVDSIVGFAEITQGNFDLFHPPTFTGGGQKLRLKVQLGTERQDYVISFTEPWFLDRKLALGVELYYRDLDFLSPEDIYTESRAGIHVGLDRALWSDFVRGGVYYTIERIGIDLEPGIHDTELYYPAVGPPVIVPANAPRDIVTQAGDHRIGLLGGTLVYDTRNNTRLPNAGQRSEVVGEIASTYLGSSQNYVKVEANSAWYFKGFGKGHVLEIGGRLGVVQAFDGDTVPFYERFYLGGLYSLRGFEFRDVGPRQQQPIVGGYSGNFSEPVGGNTFWFGTVEYSVPIFNTESGGLGARFAVFYDVGSVGYDTWDWNLKGYSSDWGVGLRLNLPIGPLRLDYAFPLEYDSQFSDGKGRFQFGVGWQRPF